MGKPESVLMLIACLLGASGVALAAAAAHQGGGTLAATAAEIALIHAAAALAIAGNAAGRARCALLLAGAVMLAGTVLFSGELALAAFAEWRPFPLAAPVGGSLLIASWMLAAGAAAWRLLGPRGS